MSRRSREGEEQPDLMVVEIDYGDGVTEAHVVTEGYSAFHPYADDQHYTVSVEEIVMDLAISSLDPDTAEIGSADVTMRVLGTGFSPTSVIVFNGGEEPTEWVSPTELTTIVKPSTATGAWTVPVTVYRPEDDDEADEVMFSFTEGGGGEPPAAPAEGGETPVVEVGYDPGAHTVNEVEDFVTSNPDQVEEVLAAEEAGKNRVTLVNWLDTFIAQQG